MTEPWECGTDLRVTSTALGDPGTAALLPQPGALDPFITSSCSSGSLVLPLLLHGEQRCLLCCAQSSAGLRSPRGDAVTADPCGLYE